MSKYLERRKKGLCTNCNAIAVVGRTNCEKCRERNRVRANRHMLPRYYAKKNKNMCPQCGFNKPMKDRVYCAVCAEKRSMQQTGYQRKKNEELGLCVVCSAKARDGKRQCAICAEKASRRYYTKVRDELQKARTQGVGL